MKVTSLFFLALLAVFTQAQVNQKIVEDLEAQTQKIDAVFRGFGVYNTSVNMSACLNQTAQSLMNTFTFQETISQASNFEQTFLNTSLFLRNFSLSSLTCFNAVDVFAANESKRLDGFDNFKEFGLAFMQNLFGSVLLLQKGFDKMKIARESGNQVEELFWVGKLLNYVLVFEPIMKEKEIVVEQVHIIWSFRQQIRDTKFMDNIYTFEQTTGEKANYFSHPLYFVDFMQGIIEGTKLVTPKQAQKCTDGFKELIVASLQMDGQWRQVVYQTLNMMYYQYDITGGCYFEVIQPAQEVTVHQFKASQPNFMQRNLLKNFGPIVNNGFRVIEFFSGGKTDAGGSAYKEIGSRIGNTINSILYQ